MEKYLGILKAIGVHEHGAKIYLSLLERGEKNISELTKISSLYRVEIYRQLPFLIESGLVLEVLRGKRKKYMAASPYKIKEMYQSQQEDIETHVEQLVQKFSHANKKPRVLYQEGKKALMYVFSDIVQSLKTGDVFYRVSSERDVSKSNTYLPKNYREIRDKKQLERYVIMSEQGVREKKPRLERDLISIPTELDDFEDNISLTLYGDKIAYIDFTSETSIVIEHAALADFHKKMFRIMYSSLRHSQKKS